MLQAHQLGVIVQFTKYGIGMEKGIMRLLLLLLLLPNLVFAQLSSDTATVASGSILYKGVSAPGNCSCGSTNPASPCTGTSIIDNNTSTSFEWTFSCSGGNCQCGQFVNGDYWVKHPSGGDVTISAVTPSGNENGLMIDPSTSFATGSQGLLGNGVYYSSSLNKMLSLPLTVSSNKTLVKAKQCTDGGTCTQTYTAACGGYAAQSYSMLTVLGTVPNDGANGGNTFRPPYVAGSKPTHTLSEFDFTRLPAKSDITVTQTTLNTAANRWGKPYPDVMGLEQGRCFVPGYYPDEYAGGIAQRVIEDIMRVLGDTSALDPVPARVALIQRGLDVYYSWQAGNKWTCSAGQCLGRFPPVVFMAALSTNSTIVATVQGAAATDEDAPFQEIGQLSPTPNSGGEVLWGAGDDGYFDAADQHIWPGEMARQYWSGLFASKCYDGANGGNPSASCKDGDSKGAVGDPYGYIDGPAGLPASQYAVDIAGPHVGHAGLMMTWEHYCEAANDQDPIDWADKFAYSSYSAAPGMVLDSDPCAPPDPNESASCNAYTGANCTHFGGRSGATDGNSTWGPLPSDPSQCIPNNSNGNTGQTGRFSWLNGQRFMRFTSTAGSITYNQTPYFAPSNVSYATRRTSTPHCANGVWTP